MADKKKKKKRQYGLSNAELDRIQADIARINQAEARVAAAAPRVFTPFQSALGWLGGGGGNFVSPNWKKELRALDTALVDSSPALRITDTFIGTGAGQRALVDLIYGHSAPDVLGGAPQASARGASRLSAT